ncbi:hypothetical protein [Undibacterium rugosum]|nr:hypothetical protein [Undibacterium rugosum]
MQFASDVIRDGMGLELIDESNTVVAEVFRNDSTHELVFSAFTENIPFIEIEKLVSVARHDLQTFEDGTVLPMKKE